MVAQSQGKKKKWIQKKEEVGEDKGNDFAAERDYRPRPIGKL